MIGPIRRGMVRRHANTDTRFSIDNQPLLPRAAMSWWRWGNTSMRLCGAAARREGLRISASPTRFRDQGHLLIECRFAATQ